MKAGLGTHETPRVSQAVFVLSLHATVHGLGSKQYLLLRNNQLSLLADMKKAKIDKFLFTVLLMEIDAVCFVLFVFQSFSKLMIAKLTRIMLLK